MAVLPIIIYPDERLYKPCTKVSDISDEIRTLMDDMAETMYEAPGIGLAAAQVASPHRVIVLDVGNDEDTGKPAQLYQIANPVITKREGTVDWEEGCLSIPDIREIVRRSASVSVEGMDKKGKAVKVDAEGLLAVCFQHEIDHLDGVLFIDRVSSLKRRLLKPKLRRLFPGG